MTKAIPKDYEINETDFLRLSDVPLHTYTDVARAMAALEDMDGTMLVVTAGLGAEIEKAKAALARAAWIIAQCWAEKEASDAA